MASAATTVTVLQTVTALATGSSSSASAGAAPQAGVLEGMNPAHYNPKDPIILFIIQASVIIIMCRLLYYPLRYLGQPRVIAEVIGGIVLGPSVMARIPGFRQAIFPTESMPVLSNVANLGLIIFMFITALEVDLGLFLENWRVALSVGFAGMILPFGMGCGIAWGIYNQFKADMVNEIEFGIFALFIGTALAITAFPVLCRILTELKLLGSSVGVTVLAAGVGNDVVGWILLALCVSLTNNAGGLSALYALLCCVGWILLLVYAVRPAFIYVLRRSGTFQDGPSPGMVTLTLLMVLASSFFTGIIGVHPIFGGFLVGLITPHEGGFAIKLTQKIEDFVGVLFLPLYFALSGLNTNIGLLNDGIVWGYVVAIIVIAFAGKIIGGTLAARACGLLWRESSSIGVLMSCKGLVELIVLNIGLQAGILSPRTFTMFVIMALITTVTTTPLTKLLYPPWYQKKLERWRRGETDWDGNPLVSSETGGSVEKLSQTHVRRVLVYLRLDSLPSLFTFIALLGGTIDHSKDASGVKPGAVEEAPDAEDGESAAATTQPPSIKERPLEVHGLRMLELTDRTSSVMQVTEGSDLAESDPIVNAFRTFSQLHEVAVSGEVAVVPTNSYAETLMTQALEVSSDFVLIPWSKTGSMMEDQFAPSPVTMEQRLSDRAHLDFVNEALQMANCNAGVFINNGFGGASSPPSRPALSRNISRVSMRSVKDHARLLVTDRRHQLFFPFMGGADDRVALRFVLQLAKNPLLTVTIAHVCWSEDEKKDAAAAIGTPHPGDLVKPGEGHNADGTPGSKVSSAPTTPMKTPMLRPGETAAVAGAEEEEEDDDDDAAVLASVRTSLSADLASRVTFTDLFSTSRDVVGATLEMATRTVGKTRRNAGDIVVVGRVHRRLGDRRLPADSSATGASAGLDLRRTLGLVGERLVLAPSLNASLLVIKAAGRRRNGEPLQ